MGLPWKCHELSRMLSWKFNDSRHGSATEVLWDWLVETNLYHARFMNWMVFAQRPRHLHRTLMRHSWSSLHRMVTAFAHYYGTAMGLPWDCHGTAMGLPWDCHGTAMGLPWDSHGTAARCHETSPGYSAIRHIFTTRS